MIKLFDLVRLTRDVEPGEEPGALVEAGTIGTVVEIYPEGGFEVEFESDGGLCTYGIPASSLALYKAAADMRRPEKRFVLVFSAMYAMKRNPLVGTAMTSASTSGAILHFSVVGEKQPVSSPFNPFPSAAPVRTAA
jgi:hypothetical protein